MAPSTFKEYEAYDALGLAALVKRREVSAGELLDAALARVAARNPAINAVCGLNEQAARAAIAAGLPAGPFEGVPFLLKDITAAAVGFPMSQGSRFFAGETSDVDSEVVARHRRSGLVIFGRTTTPEMAISPSTEGLVYGGPTRNPWRLDHSAGGSSGGAAAAVAAGIVPMAHATDGAGSIRIPAACCGLFGLKLTRGRTPAGPLAGEGWGGLSGTHVISRSVRDSAAALDATHGPDLGAPYYAPPAPPSFLDAALRPPGRLRIAFMRTTLDGTAIHPEVAAAADDAARLCESLGHAVAEARPPVGTEEMLVPLMKVVACGTAMNLERRIRALGREPAADELEPVTRGALEVGRRTSGTEYLLALATLHALGRRVARFFLDHDVLLMPTLAEPPAKLGRFAMTNPDFMDYRLGPNGIAPYSPFTPLANMSGQPAATVPLAWSKDGLPIGIQFVARAGDEATLLALAAQLEQARPWAAKRPKLD
jgi:amidase/6-aminohexanoate-cyclic-dimer hydrolase